MYQLATILQDKELLAGHALHTTADNEPSTIKCLQRHFVCVYVLLCTVQFTPADLSKLSGPARDGIPTAAADTQAPTAPSALIMQVDSQISLTSIVLRWTLSSDNTAVAGYQLQLVKASTATFTAANAVPGYFNVDVGNTEVLLIEGLTRGQRYHARLRARDLFNRWSPWSSARTFNLP
jgi:hypothetical protein